MCLTSELAVGTHLAGHARYLSRKYTELLNHGVDDIGGAQELPFERTSVDVKPDGLGQVTLRHSRDRAGHFCGWPKQVFDESVDRGLHLTPGPSGLMKSRAFPRFSFLAHNLANAL